MTLPARRYLPAGPVPRAIAHRGLALEGNENTIAAFKAAVAAGAHVIETDTRATADGVAVTWHDPSTGRLASRDYLISDTRMTTLEQLSIGPSRICSLHEALERLPQAFFNIDVKDVGAALPTAKAIAAAGAADRVCLTSFDGYVAKIALNAVKDLTGVMPVTSASRNTVLAFRTAVAVGAPRSVIRAILAHASALQIPEKHAGIPLVTPRTIAAAHSAGCEVHVWTVDEDSDMRRLARMGVDGIVSNRVDVLARVLDNRQD